VPPWGSILTPASRTRAVHRPARVREQSPIKAISACVFSRSLTVAVLYRACKRAAPEYQCRKCCKYVEQYSLKGKKNHDQSV
jgi:hypothetical protein